MRVAGHWRLRKQRLTLQGEICPVCGAHIFPPRDVCPECGQPASTPYTFSGKGEVYSFSTVYEVPDNFMTNLRKRTCQRQQKNNQLARPRAANQRRFFDDFSDR